MRWQQRLKVEPDMQKTAALPASPPSAEREAPPQSDLPPNGDADAYQTAKTLVVINQRKNAKALNYWAHSFPPPVGFGEFLLMKPIQITFSHNGFGN